MLSVSVNSLVICYTKFHNNMIYRSVVMPNTSRAWWPGFISWKGQEILLFPKLSRLALRPAQHPIQWVPEDLSLGIKRQGWKLPIHQHLTPRLWMLELYFIFSICLDALDSTVLNYTVIHRVNFTWFACCEVLAFTAELVEKADEHSSHTSTLLAWSYWRKPTLLPIRTEWDGVGRWTWTTRTRGPG
jgi:hypothetical protein